MRRKNQSYKKAIDTSEDVEGEGEVEEEEVEEEGEEEEEENDEENEDEEEIEEEKKRRKNKENIKQIDYITRELKEEENQMRRRKGGRDIENDTEIEGEIPNQSDLLDDNLLNTFTISLPLIKKYKEMRPGDPDSYIIDFLTKVGLPMQFIDEQTLALYLYFHKMSIPFYSLFDKIKNRSVSKSILSLLKESYYLLSDDVSKFYNYEDIAKRAFYKMKVSSADTDISKIPVLLKNKIIPKGGEFQLQKLILELGFKSCGRLDIYVKIHIMKAVVGYYNNEELKNFAGVLLQMENELMKLYNNSENAKLTQEKYDEMVKVFTDGEMSNKWNDYLSGCKDLLKIYQVVNDTASIKLLERFFIKLLGHSVREVRNFAVKILNMIYDQTTWQEKNAFPLENTKVKLIGEDLTLELIIRKKDYGKKNIVLITNGPCENENVKTPCMSFLKSKNEEEKDGQVKLTFKLGTLQKCGYYDWYLAKFVKGRFSNLKIKGVKKDQLEGKGRIIVLNRDTRDLSIHEVFCDLIGADINKDRGEIIERGNFSNLNNKLDEYKKRDINCIYIMGALERDNSIAYDEENGTCIDIGDKDACPMAVTSRSNISSLLGGDKEFLSLMKGAHKLSMKIIIDSLSRVSSSRAHRKYRDVLLRYLDQHGKMQICYGSDGKSIRYDDSAILNYRKIEVWDMLVDEVKVLIDKYGIDGVHLDNCQSWPQIMEVDSGEMYRIDIDGQPAYTPLEILNGEIVRPNEECGYWDTDTGEDYANPLLIKFTRSIWNEYPEFIFFGECWLNEKGLLRHVNLTKSGIIPRMYTLPIILCEMMGKKIQRDGNIKEVEPSDINIIQDWYRDNYLSLPEGALLIQSSCGQVWPYPAYLYGRGNWSAVDLLFSLPDIPMTFMDEIDGEAYRVKITNVYELKDPNATEASTSASSSSVRLRSKSLMRLIETKEKERNEKKDFSRTNSNMNISDYLPQFDLAAGISAIINLSGVEVAEVKDINTKQENLVKSLGPEKGFDLTKIRYHYDHRRKMRKNLECLRRGNLIFLSAYDTRGDPHQGVLTFARRYKDVTAVFAINFRSEETTFLIDFSPLINEETNDNTLCYIKDWENEENSQYHFLREVTEGHVTRKIGPYQSACFGFSLAPYSKENVRKTIETSNRQMVNEIKTTKNTTVDSYQITIQLKEILKNKSPLKEFGKWMNTLCDVLTESSVSFIDYIHKLDFINDNEKLTSEFFKYCYNYGMIKDSLSGTDAKLAQEAEILFKSNTLGVICFLTPELGRWSTVGGLGIMVDELSQGLTSIGQKVLMISPYYNQNRKGATDYLANDPFNIKYLRNVAVNLDGNYTFGVHHGTGNDGIDYYFLHNARVFPRPYPDFGPADTCREIASFAKASLQLLCDIGVIPSIILTNDWFTGLAPAYAKNGAFGDTFKGTTFFHICHNLEPTYEGRLYPSPQEGTLEGIYQFNSEWLIDPTWKQRVINPSRCALMMSDQWGTVSNSYKADLKKSSPLNFFLNQKPNPFSYPNGIFKEKRLKVLKEKAGGNRAECKKYIQQKYFGYQNADFNVPIYSFVGRLTQQKGILLILDSVEELIRITGGKINILVGGMGNPRDPYVAACIGKMNYLKGKYPYAFWANPFEFFTDGAKINMGSDFGLMPSLFEPGGIVQHEFFIAGTPVIAFRTGGLKDTVFEFRWDNNTGNGVTFDNYNCGDLIAAVQRSLGLFKNREKWEICSKNCTESAIDVAVVSRAWCKEFYRLKNKIFFNVKDAKQAIEEQEEQQKLSADEYNIKSLSGSTSTNPHRHQYGTFSRDTDTTSSLQMSNNFFAKKALASMGQDIRDLSKSDMGIGRSESLYGSEANPVTFAINNFQKRPKEAFICGSFDDWKVKHKMKFDPFGGGYCITLNLKKGRYFYKYVLDDSWEINPKEPTCKDKDGIVNNVIEV